MRTIPILLVITSLSAGCATGPGFDRLLLDPSGTSTSVDPVAVASLTEDDPKRDVQPDADKSTASVKVAGAIRQTGRVIKCGAIGAVAGLVVVPVALTMLGGPSTAGVSGNPSAWTTFALIGMALGVTLAFQEPRNEFC